jgi:phosphoribosylformimino-5-aminoimidazole carboxamide ribotide isomerase
MIVIPAIDMRDHQVVRLKQGRLSDTTVYAASTLTQAEIWINQGATRLHLVDLNGAFEGKPVHFSGVAAIAKKFPHAVIEIGGGIRTITTVRQYFEHGVSLCILGTAAIKDPELVRRACEEFPRRIILGLDAKNGQVATEGWGETSTTAAAAVAAAFADCALESIIYTDIAKDGMLAGMNLEQITVMKNCGPPLIASGGLTSLADIDALQKIGGIFGVIAGKALYEARFTRAV